MFSAQIEYSENFLEPFISAETVKYHYGKHHIGYANTLNGLIKDTVFQDLSLEDIVTQARGRDAKVFNNAAQLFNHNFYWNCLKRGVSAPSRKLMELIAEQFGDFANFKKEYAEFAATLFGSGWSWLLFEDDKLKLLNTSNAETPIGTRAVPICVIDLWEHAYYVDYRNARAEYVSKILENCINWDFCESELAKISK